MTGKSSSASRSRRAERLPAVEAEAVAVELLAQLVERPGVHHHDVGRERRRVLEDPQPAAVVAVETTSGAQLLATVHSAGALTGSRAPP